MRDASVVDLPVEGPVSEDEFFAERVRIPHLPACRRLGVGTAHLGAMLDTDRQPLAVQTLHDAWRAGFLLSDSSPNYGQRDVLAPLQHRSEQVLGHALRQWDGPTPIVCTKLDVAKLGRGQSWREMLAAQHRRSRELLAPHAIQGLALHDAHNAGDQADAFVRACMDYLHEQLDAGALAALGLGGSGPVVQRRCLGEGRVSYVITFIRLGALSLLGVTDTVPAARQHGAGIVVGSPLVTGLLGDRYREWTSRPPAHYPPVLIERARRFHTLAERVGMPMSQLALRFTLSLPMVDMVLTGLSSPDKFADARAAFEQGPLPADLYADVWQLAQQGEPEPQLGG